MYVFCVEYMGEKEYFKTYGVNLISHIQSKLAGMRDASLIISVVPTPSHLSYRLDIPD